MLDRFWEKVFLIHALRTSVRYYYACYNEREKKFYWERNKERILEVNFFNVMEQELKLSSGQFSHMSDCLYFKKKLNVFKKIDTNFHSSFSFFRVNDYLIYGRGKIVNELNHFISFANLLRNKRGGGEGGRFFKN